MLGRTSSLILTNRGCQKNIVNMCAQVDPSLTEIQPTGHPTHPGMLDEVGCLAPTCSKADEEDHLLSRAIGMWERVDNGCRSIAGECRSRVQLGNRVGCCRVGYIGTIIVETVHGDGATLLDSRALEACQVGERPELTGGGRASRFPNIGTELRRGEHIQSGHSYAIFHLVVIQRGPLIVCQGAEPACPPGLIVLVRELLESHNTGIVTVAILFQRWKRGAGLRKGENLIVDAQPVETQGAYICKACDPLVSSGDDAEDGLPYTKGRGIRNCWWSSVVRAWSDGDGWG